jgi:opacity protein-like surface antigen
MFINRLWTKQSIFMKKLAISSLLVFLLHQTNVATAQYYYYNDDFYDKDLVWEMGISANRMFSYTDVGNKKGFPPFNLNMKDSRGSAGFYVAGTYQQTFSIRLEGTWGQIAGNDENGLYPARGLSFRTSIQELSVLGELHFLMLQKNRENPPAVSPYFAIGASFFDFNPQTNVNGRWVDLKPLRLEGQGFTEYPERSIYRSPQTAITYGFGAKYDINHFITARLETLYRYTFTDYLDDVSFPTYADPALFSKYLSASQAALAAQIVSTTGQSRGNPKTKDGYLSINLKVGVTLGRQRR